MFYENLLKKLQSTFCFNLEMFVDAGAMPAENLSRRVKLALLSAQRSMICLGDIARYKEQAHHTANYGKARKLVNDPSKKLLHLVHRILKFGCMLYHF